jgi:hypothetical protein
MKTNQTNPIVSLIERWPSYKEFAADLHLSDENHGRVMKARGRIPRAYWHDLIAAAQRRHISGVTMEKLRNYHVAVWRRPS